MDGEVIAADETDRPLFYDLVRGSREPAYVAFDLLWLNGADLRSLPLRERRQRLQGILPAGSSVISEALSAQGRGRELFELMRSQDLEGIVAKRLAFIYELDPAMKSAYISRVGWRWRCCSISRPLTN
jgi:bifunctional non-homologous end joining protein LigD